MNSINYKAIVKIMGIIVLIVGISMLIPWIYAEVTGDATTAGGFRKCTPVIIVIGLAASTLFRSKNAKFRSREGYIIVAACWVLASVIGALPYYLSGFTDSFIDALFESTSGFTTTGCTSVCDIFPAKALLLWKAIASWLGGMGILVFVISILPALGINGQMIVKAETPSPVLKKVTVRMSDTAQILYITYITFTLLEFILLMLSGKMNVFDATVTSLGSISTGGLLVHPEGISYYNSFYIEIVISVFCVLSSISFILYHYVIAGKPGILLKDIEFRAYMMIIAAAVAICTIALVASNDTSIGTAFRDSFFEVVSVASTTGYTRSQYILWPSTCHIVLVALMFIGGCSASTSGSVKVMRVLVMLKLVGRGCIKRTHPRAVVSVKLGNRAIPAHVVSEITVFIFTYLMVMLVSAFILSLQGLSLESTITTALGILSNTGACFGETALAGDFSAFHPLLKLYLCGLMVIGRLELFTIIVLFSKNFWGRNR